ncbi:MAG: hypothetical protein IPK76_03080 [Lewinellaceae bacterium]|nr:hypothetical protein [Lewinellaceae bacterium]
MVPGGWVNRAYGDYSFAAGRRATANHHGTFVWADNTNANFSSTAEKQFLIRAGNGVGINKNNPATALDVNGTATATAFVGDGSALTGIPDDQMLSLSGTTLSIENGNAVNLAVLADTLGNHTATQTLDLGGNDISNGGTVTATTFAGDGSGLTDIAGDNLGNHTATQTLDLGGNDISNGGTVTATAFAGDGSALTGIPDDQMLSLSGTTLSIEDGNSVNLASLPNWSINGNAGMMDGTNFVGTTDNVPLDFRVNNERALRLEYKKYSGDFAPNVIGGYSGNTASPESAGATIGGGGYSIFPNTVLGDFGTISGGLWNTASNKASTIGGGTNNTANSNNSTIGGGQHNTANGGSSTIGGGAINTTSGISPTIGAVNVTLPAADIPQ